MQFLMISDATYITTVLASAQQDISNDTHTPFFMMFFTLYGGQGFLQRPTLPKMHCIGLLCGNA